MKRITIGFGVMAAVYAGTYAYTGSHAHALVVMCVTLALLPPSIDPAIQIEERQMRP